MEKIKVIGLGVGDFKWFWWTLLVREQETVKITATRAPQDEHTQVYSAPRRRQSPRSVCEPRFTQGDQWVSDLCYAPVVLQQASPGTGAVAGASVCTDCARITGRKPQPSCCQTAILLSKQPQDFSLSGVIPLPRLPHLRMLGGSAQHHSAAANARICYFSNGKMILLLC